MKALNRFENAIQLNERVLEGVQGRAQAIKVDDGDKVAQAEDKIYIK